MFMGRDLEIIVNCRSQWHCVVDFSFVCQIKSLKDCRYCHFLLSLCWTCSV